jgi:hypothetical protein
VPDVDRDTAVYHAIRASHTFADPDSTLGWVRVGSAPNYLTQQRYRLAEVPALEPVSRGGTAPHASVDSDRETFRIARDFQVDEQDILADRLDATREVVASISRAAKRLRPDLVYSLLLANGNLADGIALFASARGNLGEAGSALAAATLGTGYAAIQNATQTDNENRARTPNIQPAYLVVAPDLWSTAAGVLHGLSVGRGQDLVLRTESRIGTNGVLDPVTKTARAGTATNWFLLAPVGEAPVVEVAYLSGRQEPTVRRFALKGGEWGFAYDVKLDIGALVLGWRGSYKATGASE